jgi:DNA-directed RNA polymerase specialized sigma24 family protein
MTDPESQDIINRSRAGDQAAFATLVRGYYPVAYALAVRILCDEMEAEDVAQEAFIRVWRNLDRFDPETRFTTWLYRIVTNLSLDRIRSRRRRGDRIADHREDDPPSELVETSTPESIASSSELFSPFATSRTSPLRPSLPSPVFPVRAFGRTCITPGGGSGRDWRGTIL